MPPGLLTFWNQKRQLLAPILIWIGWLASFLFGYRDQWRQFQQAKDQLPALSQKMESYGAWIAAVPNPPKALEELRHRRQKLAEKRANSEMVPHALQQLAQLAAATGIALETIGPREETDPIRPLRLPPGVGKKMIEVRMRCTYKGLGEFLSRLRELSTPMAVDQLTVRATPQLPPDSVVVEMLVGAYGLV